MDLNLANKTVLITGGGSGIGLATAKSLNEEQARTVLFDKKNSTNFKNQNLPIRN